MKIVFIEGAISPSFIADIIQKHQIKRQIGAHNVFMGQVRADLVDGKKVAAIDFSSYRELAEKALNDIRENAFGRFNLVCLHIYHSLGRVSVGNICFVVFVSASHRTEVYAATEYIVNEVKAKAPIFGKEIFEDESAQWKVNNLP